MNIYAIKAIYLFEMSRTFRTRTTSILAPVISTILYFVVFGSAIGSKIGSVEGISYGVFIVPGLVMLLVLPSLGLAFAVPSVTIETGQETYNYGDHLLMIIKRKLAGLLMFL